MAARTSTCESEPEFSQNSGTDMSEDSVEVSVKPVGENPQRRNKRKSSEPRKLKEIAEDKRYHWDWGSGSESESMCHSPRTVLNLTINHEIDDNDDAENTSDHDNGTDMNVVSASRFHTKQNISTIITNAREAMSRENTSDSCSASGLRVETTASHTNSNSCLSKPKQRNYKNMTRERRIEANARERTRVHTISAAFESLRRAVPSYSYDQKLSKLAILRIACSYILALARLNNLDYSESQEGRTFADYVDMCTRTIQTEGRARRRKD